MVILGMHWLRRSFALVLKVWPLWAGLLFMIMQIVAYAAPVKLNKENLSVLANLDANPVIVPEKPKLLLYFWATWCPTCREKLTGKLASLAERKDLEVWTVNLDQSRQRAESFIQREKLRVKVLRDETKLVQELFDVSALPHWVLLEKSNDVWQSVDSGIGTSFQRIDSHLQ